jgi:SAM-dependent methyltransferase
MREAVADSRPLVERPREVSAAKPRQPGLLRRLAERRSPRRVKVSTALRFYHEVVGLDHLHYGLWNGEPLTLDGLKVAQDRFTRHLLSWIPEGVRSVLDVGCGIGSTALMLKQSGYEVEGLSPDPYHQSVFSRRVGTPFHLSRFQEFRPLRRYDLVLMSESAQYIWLDRLFPAVGASAPGGHLLVADYFTVNGAKGALGRSGHALDRFLAEARTAGLDLVRREDVTERVAPTLELARSWIERYLDPCLALVSGITFRTDRRRRGPRLQGGPLRPRQRHGGGRRRRRRPATTSTSSTSSAATSCGATSATVASRTSPAAGVALADRVSVAASFADIDNDGDPDLFVTTVRMRQRAVREPRRRALPRTSPRPPAWATSGHSSGAVFFDYDRDGLLDLFVTNVGRLHHRAQRDRGGYYVPRLGDAFGGPPPPRAHRAQPPLPQPRAATASRTSPREAGLVDTRLVRRRHVRRPERRRLAGPLRAQHAGRRPLLREPGGRNASSREPPRCSRRPPGARWASRSSTRTTTAAWTSPHRHALGHERGRGPGRRSTSPTCSGRTSTSRAARTTSSATPSTAEPGDGEFVEISDAGRRELLALGPERRRPERRRLRRSSSPQHELPLPLPDQLGAAQRRRPPLLDAEFVLGVEPRRRPHPRSRGSTRLLRRRAAAAEPYCQGRRGPVQVTGTLGSRAPR